MQGLAADPSSNNQMYQLTIWQDMTASEVAERFAITVPLQVGQVITKASSQQPNKLVNVSIYSTRKQKSSAIQQSLLLMAGHSASIRTGQTKIINIKHPHFIRHKDSGSGGDSGVVIEHRNVPVSMMAETGFEVKVSELANGQSDAVMLNITPFSGEFEQGGKSLSSQRISTTIAAPLGKWVVIAITDERGLPTQHRIGASGKEHLVFSSRQTAAEQRLVVLARIERASY